jgi:anti-sigma factor RsiW
MNERRINETDLHGYVDGQLDRRDRLAVEAHLSTHPDDAAAVAAFQKQNAALQAALAPVLNEPLPERLKIELWALPTRKRGRPWMLAACIALASGLVLGAAGTTLLEDRIFWVSTNDAAMLARAAAEAYRVFIPEVLHPVEVEGGREEHLLQWLSKRLGYPMSLPDLKNDGYTLVGGRLLAGPQGPAALFMFERSDGTRITLYCGKLKPSSDTAFRYIETNGVQTIYWISENTGFAVTGPLERNVLQHLAQRFFTAMDQDSKRPS